MVMRSKKACIGSSHVAPVESECLERRPIRYVPPLLESGVEGEDAVIAAVEATREHVGLRQAVVQGYGGEHCCWHRVPGVDDIPVDGMDQRAGGRDPASDDAVVALMADDDIGLAEGSVANDADEDDSRAVHRDPADAKVESSIGLIAGLVVGQVVTL